MRRIVEFIDWAARAHFVGTITWAAGGWAVTFFAASAFGSNPVLVWVWSVVVGAGFALIFIAIRTRGIQHGPPVLPAELTARPESQKLSLYEAATRAYEALEDKPYGIAVYGLADTPEDRLTWLCNAIFRYVDGKKPLATLYGSEPPSRLPKALPMEVYDNYRFEIEDKTVILKSGSGTSRFENLSTDLHELEAAITELASRDL